MRYCEALKFLTDNGTNCFEEMTHFKLKYPTNMLLSYINVNSIRSKFENFTGVVGEQIDILVIAETKIDSSFYISEFLICGFKGPYRLNVSGNGGGVLVYVRDNPLSKQLNTLSTQPDIQVVLFEINARKQKWLVLAIYKMIKQNSRYFVEQIYKLFDQYSRYENVMVLGSGVELTE